MSNDETDKKAGAARAAEMAAILERDRQLFYHGSDSPDRPSWAPEDTLIAKVRDLELRVARLEQALADRGK